MNRAVGWGLTLAVVAGLVAMGGCVGRQVRSQSGEDVEPEKYDVKTVGDVTEFGNVEPVVVAGVGLVVNLEGTGGSAPPGSERTLLEDSLRKNKDLLDKLLRQTGARDVKDLLNSPNTAMVRVSAVIPAGARKGDPLDVEVAVPPQSKVTSLRNGYLVETVLHNYDYARNLSPNHADSNMALKGHPLAVARGALLVGFGDGDEEAKVKAGRIWGGARCCIDRPFFLLMKGDQQLARVASAVADKINETFHGSVRGPGSSEIAVAKNKQVVLLNVPPQYRLNLPRFLRVVRLVPLREAPEKAAAAKGPPKLPYRQRLEEDLTDPARTVMVALRLEALGHKSVDVLKAALTDSNTLVRFSAAEALAYLGEPAAGKVLAELIEDHAVLRAFSLTALASLNEGICHDKLHELLTSPNAETRYGAFRALRVMDENSPDLGGELLNNAFWLHRVAPHSTPLVHISSSKRAEIVLFGDDAVLLPPFSFRAGEYTFVAGVNDTRCTISHFSLKGGRDTRQCSLKLDDVLRTLASLRGSYPEAVELLRQASSCRCVSCRVEVDRLPQAVSVYDLARSSQDNPELLGSDAEILNARPDFGSTPTLYERSFNRRPRGGAVADQEALLQGAY
jgi:hypothetical protein